MPLYGAEVQKAVYGKLAAALAPVPVYDHAPADAAFPFVDISKQQILPSERGLTPLSGELASHNLYLTVWSNYRGKAEVLGIIGQIYTALHNQPLALDAGKAVVCQIASAETVLDQDGVTYQGAVTVRLKVSS